MRRLLLCMLLGTLGLMCFLFAYAKAETVTLEGIRYEIRDGYAFFAGFEEGVESVTAHAMVNGYLTQYLWGEEQEENQTVKELTIGSEITDLDQISTLQSLLYMCRALERITLPKSLTNIGGCFSYTNDSLQEFAVAKDNTAFMSVDGVLFSKDGGTLLAFPEGKGERYDIPTGVRAIGKGAFGYNEHLKYLTIPEGITQLEEGALMGLMAIQDIVLPASLADIKNDALPSGEALQQITVSEGNLSFQSKDGVLFSKDGWTLMFFPSGKGGQYDVPPGTTSIMEDAFGPNTALKSLTLPEGITELKEGALWNLNGLTQLSLPASLRSIGDMALPGYGALELITVADGNEQYQTFEGVLFSRDGKTLLLYPAGRRGAYEIPPGTLFLAENAFVGSENLTGVTVPDGVTALPRFLFSSNAALEEIHLPATLEEIGENALPEYGAIRRVEVKEGNRHFRSVDGVLFEGEELIYYPLNHGQSYDVPAGTVHIRNGAFSNSEILETVSIPRSVKEIGEETFYCCTSLARVSLPITLTKISRSAFANCIALSSIILPPGLTKLEGSAFYNCPSLAQIQIPDGVTELDTYVFRGHSPDFVLYASKGSAGFWHAWEYDILWAEPGGMPGVVKPVDRQTQSAVVNNASSQESLKLFSKPDTGAKSLGKFANGTTVQVLDIKDDWAHVQLYGAQGYMPLDALVFTDKFNDLVHITWGRKRQTMAEPLRLYEGPSEKAPAVVITEDVSMRILDTEGVWYHVLMKEREGYIPVQDLNVVHSQMPDYENNISYCVVANPKSQDRLHLREQPSTKSRSLGRYFNGTQVEIIDQTNQDGWVHVRVEGQEGYMMLQYLIGINWGGESNLWGHG